MQITRENANYVIMVKILGSDYDSPKHILTVVKHTQSNSKKLQGLLAHFRISQYVGEVPFCRTWPSVGDCSGGPVGSLAVWRSGGSHLHLLHLESGKERKHSWWVVCNFPLNVYLSSCEIHFN